MSVEDDFLAEIEDYEHRIEMQTQIAEQERLQKEEAVRKQEEAIKLLLSLGVPKEDIAQKLGIALEDVAKLEEDHLL